MENRDPEIGIKEVREFLFAIIDSMSDEEMRKLLKDLEAHQNKERRHFDRKDFLTIIDHTVEDRYYRNFIENISESGLIFRPPHTFSVG